MTVLEVNRRDAMKAGLSAMAAAMLPLGNVIAATPAAPLQASRLTALLQIVLIGPNGRRHVQQFSEIECDAKQFEDLQRMLSERAVGKINVVAEANGKSTLATFDFVLEAVTVSVDAPALPGT